MHAQQALRLGSEASNSENINNSEEPMRSTPLGANLQQHFREALFPLKRQGGVVLGADTHDSLKPRCDGPAHGFELLKSRPEKRASLRGAFLDRTPGWAAR